jgi:hypothetical protein
MGREKISIGTGIVRKFTVTQKQKRFMDTMRRLGRGFIVLLRDRQHVWRGVGVLEDRGGKLLIEESRGDQPEGKKRVVSSDRAIHIANEFMG